MRKRIVLHSGAIARADCNLVQAQVVNPYL
jgi:hypothetical protein